MSGHRQNYRQFSFSILQMGTLGFISSVREGQIYFVFLEGEGGIGQRSVMQRMHADILVIAKFKF